MHFDTMIKSVVLTLLALSVWGCGNTDAYIRSGDTVKRSEVTMIRLPHVLKAEDDKTETLSSTRKAALADFLKDSGLQYGDVAHIDPGKYVSTDRIAEVVDYMKSLGVVYGGTGIFGAEPSLNDMVIYIERHVVKAPNCSNWAESSTVSVRHNQTTPNYGCATARNLGLMIADPKDLLRGKKPTSSNTESAVQAVKSQPSSGQQ